MTSLESNSSTINEFWTKDEQGLVQLIRSFLSSNQLSHDNLSQNEARTFSLPPSSPEELVELLSCLLGLIQSLTQRLEDFAASQLELSSSLKVSQSNLILAQSTVESLEQLILKLQCPPPVASAKRRDRSESEQDVGLYSRLNLFRFTRKALAPHPIPPLSASSTPSVVSDTLTAVPLRPQNFAASPSPSLTCSSTYSSSFSSKRSSDSFNSSASSRPAVEIEKLRQEVAQLASQNSSLRANLETVSQAKKEMEADLENMSMELFEEANRMVRVERIKSVSLETELIELRNKLPLHSTLRKHRTVYKEEYMPPVTESLEPVLIKPSWDTSPSSPDEVKSTIFSDSLPPLSRVLAPMLRTREPTDVEEEAQEGTSPPRRPSSVIGLKPLLLSTASPLTSPTNTSNSNRSSIVSSHQRVASGGGSRESSTPFPRLQSHLALTYPTDNDSPSSENPSPLSFSYHALSPAASLLSSAANSSFSPLVSSPVAIEGATICGNHRSSSIKSQNYTPKRPSSIIYNNSRTRSPLSLTYTETTTTIRSGSGGPISFFPSQHRFSSSSLRQFSSSGPLVPSPSSSALDYHGHQASLLIKRTSSIMYKSPSGAFGREEVYDLDQLMASIVDCAESLGMEEELQGIIY